MTVVETPPARPLWRRAVRVALVATLVVVVPVAGYATVVGVARQRPRTLPVPSGRYHIGRTMREWTDPTRIDPLAPQPGQPRRLAVWIWYPVEAAVTGPAAPYAPGLWQGVADQGFLAGPLDRIATSAVEDAPPAAGRFPVVVLEPGLGLAAPHLTTLGQELASQGLIVAAVTPTYSANVTVLDGRVVGRTAKGNPQDPSDTDLGGLVTVWAADARFAAGQLSTWDSAHVDTGRVAYVGHSLGGAASLQACHDDPACAGAADLDGTPYGPVAATGLAAPFLLLGSQDGCLAGSCASAAGDRTIEAAGRTLQRASSGPHWAYSVAGAEHFNFTDYAAYFLAPPLQHLLGELGPIDGSRGLTVTNGCVTAFLDHVLRGGPPPGGLEARYPELRAGSGSPAGP